MPVMSHFARTDIFVFCISMVDKEPYYYYPLRMEQQLREFLLWLQTNGVQLRTSTIRTSLGKFQGLGVFSTRDNDPGVLMATPLNLAITPMSVLQNPELGEAYGKLFQEGEVDDRLLVILFLLVERLRGESSLWAPYFDVLPTSFGTPLWFAEQEIDELKGTNLFNATKIQLRNLKAHFREKVKPFAQQILSSTDALKREIEFEDFLWANSIFWTRALNIPCPRPFVFPDQTRKELDIHNPCLENDILGGEPETSSRYVESETVWVEGLVPGIDFCNHASKGLARWEVDGLNGSVTGVPNSMYLITDEHLSADDEILISYGDKGNEELLFLYGFVLENNPSDYFMVHFPKEALDQDSYGEAKIQLIQEQNLMLRWLLPGTLLQTGFYSNPHPNSLEYNNRHPSCTNYSWSGNRKPPSFLQQFVFPEDMIAALRVVAMKEDQLLTVISMLEELSQTGMQKTPSVDDIKAAIWEVCGNVNALQLLADLISSRLMELEEGTGPEEADRRMLSCEAGSMLTENMRSCLIYRSGQKNLARQFLREVEHLLELSIVEEQQ